MSDETTKPGAPNTKETAENVSNVENKGPPIVGARAQPGSALSVLSGLDKTVLRLNKYDTMRE